VLKRWEGIGSEGAKKIQGMQKRKMSHTDVIRNENGITMTLDR